MNVFLNQTSEKGKYSLPTMTRDVQCAKIGKLDTKELKEKRTKGEI